MSEKVTAMYVQRLRPSNPYTAFEAMRDQRSLLGERGTGLNAPELKLDQLSAPLVKAQLLAHAQRYERLGEMLSGVLPALGNLAAAVQAQAKGPNPETSAPQAATARVLTGTVTDAASMPAEGATDPLATETRTPATAARLLSATALSLRPGTEATTASMMSDVPRLRLDTGAPATAAKLTLGQVQLNTTQMTRAELRGDNLNLSHKAVTADFGSITINGVTTTLGVYKGNDEREAAQFLADRINGNQANTVSATIDVDLKRLTLTSKTPGTAGNIVINRMTADSDGDASNDETTGFHVGDAAAGTDGGVTDFGSVTINGVTTIFGVLDNRQQSSQTATQWLVDRLNGNQANTVTASVGGANRDQLVLTSKQLGSQGQIRIDQVSTDSDGNALNAGATGLVAGTIARGQDATAGVTDLGAITVNGVTTTFGRIDNTGQTTRSVAQYMIDRLNANAANPVLASLGGANRDQVVLTARSAGSAGSFQIDRVASDTDGLSNDGYNGWVTGRRATGTDATSGVTDFGSVTINGITTVLGVVDGREHTAQSAMQYLLDRLNQTNPTLTARSQDGRILLESRDVGNEATLTIDAVTAGSDQDPTNDRGLGFVAGQSATGLDEEVVRQAPAKRPQPVNPPTVGSVPVAPTLDKTSEVVQGLNQYLQALHDEQEHLPKSVQGFRTALTNALKQEEGTLAGLGIQVKGDRLEVDEATFQEAVQQKPDEANGVFKRLHAALEPIAGAQAFAMNQMRSAAQATSKDAASISQVAANLFRIEHRSAKINWMLDEMQQAQERMREQRERLEKASQTDDKARDKTNALEDDRKDTESDRPAPNEPDAPASYGLLRSPLPPSFLERLGATPASQPRWPDGR